MTTSCLRCFASPPTHISLHRTTPHHFTSHHCAYISISGRRNLSPEELRERQAELAKVKALMFYEQMKRHRLNKIKSKAYRRIRKRQRLKRESDDKVNTHTFFTHLTHSLYHLYLILSPYLST